MAISGSSFGWIKVGANERMSFVCRVGGCSFVCNAPDHLTTHLTAVHLPADSSTGDGFCCPVDKCDVALASTDSFRRHLIYHAYHAKLQMCGMRCLKEEDCTKDLVCSLVPDNDVSARYAGEALECYWKDCGVTFDNVCDYYIHVGNHGRCICPTNCSFPCEWDDCTEQFLSRYRIVRHLMHHSGEKVIACPFCGSFFANKTKLINHVVRQSIAGSSALTCTLCLKSFPHERLLREHVRHHINYYRCPECGMTVESPSHLRNHLMNRHVDTRPYKCSCCDKMFKNRSDMKRHEAMHDETHQFECDKCQRKFRWQVSLRAHMKLHVQGDGRHYVCHLCRARYWRGANLSVHLKERHNITIPTGHSRFTYKKCVDGLYRLQTQRFEAVDLMKDLGPESSLTVDDGVALPNDQNGDNDPADTTKAGSNDFASVFGCTSGDFQGVTGSPDDAIPVMVPQMLQLTAADPSVPQYVFISDKLWMVNNLGTLNG